MGRASDCREEKELHVEIKKLKASRPDVKRLEQQQAELKASEANTKLSPSNKEHLEKELKVILMSMVDS